MGADINDRACEALVRHGRHGDQHLPVEVTAGRNGLVGHVRFVLGLHVERLSDRSAFANDACGEKFDPNLVTIHRCRSHPWFTMISVAAHAVSGYERPMHDARSWLRLALSAALLAFAGGARADEASAWSNDVSSAIRLIAGGGKGALRHAGIEMKLQPGWHTYWRYPGDSGVPPQFD